MNCVTTCQDSEERIYHKLAESPLYQTYRNAFVEATGLSLVLLPADEESAPAAPREFRNEFCRRMNSGSMSCQACIRSHRCLSATTGERAQTITCFAGMRETAVPVRAGGKTIAFLATGEIFTGPKREEDFAPVAEELRNEGLDSREVEELHVAWAKSPVVSKAKYEGTITLLAAFGLQLADLLNRLMLENENSEPEVVTKAKQYVNGRLDERVTLEQVANHVGVSTFYFCKVFKQSTGLTLTEYINRRRIETAKKRLLNPRARVTEVAFDVGYQSLSQFNRSFLRYVGESPTRYRERQSRQRGSLSAAVA